MRPDLQFSVLCEDVRQERKGSFIFIGVTGILRGAEFPQRLPRIFVVNAWCKGVGKHTQGIKIISCTNDKVIFGSDKVSFALKDLNDRKVIIAQFQNVIVPEPGNYSVEISLDDQLKLAYPLIFQKIRLRSLPRPGEPKN